MMNKKYGVVGDDGGGFIGEWTVLSGDDERCELENEFGFKVGVDEIVRIGEEVGLWRLENGVLYELKDGVEGDFLWNDWYKRVMNFIA